MIDPIPALASDRVEETRLFAKAAVLMDAGSGRILYQKNGDHVLPMASTTKIMTCIVALENSEKSQLVTISKRAAAMPDVQLNAKEGDHFYLEDLLYSLMLESHNDSAVAIAEAVGGSVEGFARMMNEKAKALGCVNTHFITPNGLDAKDEGGIHGTTATELARIMAYCVNESPQRETFLKITQTPSCSFHNVSVDSGGETRPGSRRYACVNHNAFLGMMEGAESGKTGFTGNAGYCYVGSLKSGECHLIVALLACGWPPHKTRKWQDVRLLMQYGLDAYTYTTFEKGDVEKAGKVEVKDSPGTLFGGTYELPLIVREDADCRACDGVLLKEGEMIRIEAEVPRKVTAPIRKGQKIGVLRYMVGDEIYRREIVAAGESVQRIDLSYCLWVIMQKWLVC
ncbi:MAG: D-alanyl-D-alanine carboxypeptidase [Lachnospiraceae bacterium]|nr:D-alanyl-D-alanine carboxypeptidase [Lachnospiraceae bacterium]